MRPFVAFLLTLGAYASASIIPVDDSAEKIWPIPQKDGSVQWMTRSQALTQAALNEPQQAVNSRQFDKLRYFLYTQSNPIQGFEINMNESSTLSQSPFNKNHPTRFFVHGWGGNYLGPQIQKIREALLLNGEQNQYNFFVVDWSVYADTINYIWSYENVPKAGKEVAQFIDWVHASGGLSFETLALYGHSLGAHVVGFAGKNVQGGQVDTIIGVDTALPLFDYDNPATRLSSTDARYVESIHTNGGLRGFYDPIGQAAFYPNGGKRQPGCGFDFDGACAHIRAVDYLAEALRRNADNGFSTVRCNEFSEVKNKACKQDSGGVRLGDPGNSASANGVYYLETNSESPFGRD